MEQSELDRLYMQQALHEAEEAGRKGEVPIGAVLVRDNGIIARGHNLRESCNDPSAHAEMVAIRAAAEQTGHWRLLNTTLYVTLEPCVMCMGAIILARIPRLVFACRDPRAGAVGSIYNFAKDARFNHSVAASEGVLADESSQMLQQFFQQLRARNKARKKPNP